MTKDNRIPDPLCKKLVKEPKNSQFIEFSDWISKEEHKSTDWIVVARSLKEKEKKGDLFTFSALLLDFRGIENEILSTVDWEVDHRQLGIPEWIENYHPKKVRSFDFGDQFKTLKGSIFRPFTFIRTKYDKSLSLELAQAFVLYYNAFYDTDSGEYRRRDEQGDVVCIARLEREGQILSVDSRYLRDFLSQSKAILVRYHDHRRYINEELERDTIQVRDNARSYDIYINTKSIMKDEKGTHSSLYGKDLILPFPEPYTSFLEQREYCNFIVEMDTNGKNIEETCEEALLSSYWADKGRKNFLTPIFFQKEVLTKYYSEPSKYNVSPTSVSHSELWHLPIGINQDGFVQAWLGDLGRIPYKEQLHWRQYNVPPRGGIPEDRMKRDFNAEFAAPEDNLEYKFQQTFQSLNDTVHDKTAEWFFRPPSPKEKYLLDIIRVPITPDIKEFDDVIQALAKLCVDLLNNALLTKLSGKKIGDLLNNGLEIKGSLGLLQAYLERKLDSIEEIKEILKPLHDIWNIRSSSASHPKGKEFEEYLQKNFPRKKLSQIIESILEKMIESLNSIHKLF